MRLTNRVKSTAVGLIAGFGAGAFGGSVAYAAQSWTAYDTPEQARDKLFRAEESAIAASESLREVEQKIGEACMSVMNFYRDDPGLNYVAEDTIINDAIADTTQPCGNDPASIRADIAELRDADKNVAHAPTYVEFARMNVSDADKHQFTGEIEDYMLVGGLAFGACAGIVANLRGREQDDK